MTTSKKKPTASAVDEPKFSKVTLLNSKRFQNKQDLVSAILIDGTEYTIKEAEAMIQKYLKGKVN